ncbi:MAG: ThuA domain-containing protein [bacterium]
MALIKTLILGGTNNHDCSRSSPFCAKLLNDSGRFDAVVTTDPGTALQNAKYLAGFDLLFSDYNGPEWPEAAKTNFTDAVDGGTGLVILHAADNSFTGWIEYEKMVGLLWREGTSHGSFHEFGVSIADHNHPITRGVADFTLWDELYHKLVHMHNVPCHVLASAFSSPESGGTGNSEPVMVTTQYGAGRIFHMVLGHVWPGDPNGDYKGASMITFENPGFQKTLVRGCEWAATGDVQA